jgi:hypothetical protein
MAALVAAIFLLTSGQSCRAVAPQEAGAKAHRSGGALAAPVRARVPDKRLKIEMA